MNIEDIVEGLQRAARVASSRKASKATQKTVATSTIAKNVYRKQKDADKIDVHGNNSKHAYRGMLSRGYNHNRLPNTAKTEYVRKAAGVGKAWIAIGDASEAGKKQRLKSGTLNKEDIQMDSSKTPLLEGLMKALRSGKTAKEGMRQSFRAGKKKPTSEPGGIANHNDNIAKTGTGQNSKQNLFARLKGMRSRPKDE